MKKPVGKIVPISPFRKLVIDLMHFSAQVPGVTLERRMDLSRLLAARQLCTPKPSWTALFTKAYSIVAAAQPVLRRSYLHYPWPRYYEHPTNMVNINVSRRVNDEEVVLQAQIRSPEKRTLRELDAIIQQCKQMPVEQITTYGRIMRMSRLPLPLRRLAMWTALHWMGRRRCHNFGTFAITSVAEHGAGVLQVIPLLTSTLHYGLFDDKGVGEVRLTIDHRVMDGAAAASALVGLEETLLGVILDEVHAIRGSSGLRLAG